MVGEDQPQQVDDGLSAIEQMAKKQHESSHHITRWDVLSIEDRQCLMDAMEAAVGVIPDRILLKNGIGTQTVRTGVCRRALLEEHNQAKTSVLFGK